MMATYNWGVDKTYRADTDMNTDNSIYKFIVAASTEGYVKLAAANGVQVLGVLQNNPRAGEEATVRVMGFSKCKTDTAWSAIVCGSPLSCGSGGMAEAAFTTTACSYIVGRAEEAQVIATACVPIMIWLYGGFWKTSQTVA
jgi:hypothetical protein